MLILLMSSGFLVNVTNGLNLLNKKIDFFSCLYLVLSLNVGYFLEKLLKRSENQNAQIDHYLLFTTIFQKLYKS